MLNAHEGGATHIAFSRDGKRLATAGNDKTAKIWDEATGKLLRTLTGHTDVVWSAKFSPDGTRLATAGNDKQVKIWDTTSGQALQSLTDFDVTVNSVAFSPDGTRLATGGDQFPKIWDVATGKELMTLPGVKNATNGMVYSPDGKFLVSGGQDGTAYVWDATSGQQYLSLPSASPLDGGVAISPNCVAPPEAAFEWCGVYVATAARDTTVKIWDISPTGSRELLVVPGTLGFINPTGDHLVTSTTGENESLEHRVWLLPQSPGAVSNSADEEANNAAQLGHQVSIYNVGEWDFPPVVALSADHTRSASVNLDPNRPLPDSPAPCTGQAGERCVNSSFLARIIDTATGKELLKFPLTGQTRQTWYGGITFSPDGTRLATSNLGGMAQVWDLRDGGKELLTLTGHTGGLYRIAYSADAKRLATASQDKTAKIWDAETGKELLTLTGHTEAVNNIVFSPDGLRLVTSSFDGTAKVWDLTTGKEEFTLSGHSATIWGLAYSADGKLIATGSPDGTARIWDANSGEQLLTLAVPGGVEQLSFTTDGTRLVTTDLLDQSVRVFLLRVEDLMVLARSRVTRTLTEEECQTFLKVEKCPEP